MKNPKPARPVPRPPSPAAPSSLPRDDATPAFGGFTGTLRFAALVYFGLALLYFLPALMPGKGIYGSDYLAGGYFFHEFISRSFAAGHVPKWVPYVYGGVPLYANPGSTFYPFRFLADWTLGVKNIWPALFVIQFGFAGWGMNLLAREMGTRRWVALVSGLMFEFTGLTMSWVLAGHEGRIIVVTFAPLVFALIHMGVRTGGKLAPFAGLAATVGFALLSFQIQNAYYLLLGAAIWAVFLVFHFGVHRRRGELARVLGLGVAAIAFAFVMASVNFLPFQDYVPDSPRGMSGGRGWEYSTSYSMPPGEIADVAVPEMHGVLETYHGESPIKLHTEYVGAVVLALFALGWAYARKSRYWWFFVGLGLFALSISLGGNTPIYRLYYELLPGTKKFRAPNLSFFLVALSLVSMATLALEALAQMREERDATRSPLRRTNERERGFGAATWILGGMVVLGFVLGASAKAGTPPNLPGDPGNPFRFAFFMLLAAALLWAWLRGTFGLHPAAVLLAILTVLDLGVVGRKFFQTVPAPNEMFAEDDVASFLRSQPQPSRVWVLGGYRERNYLMRFDIEQAGGEHGNQMQQWNEFVGAGPGVDPDFHNFSAPSGAFLNAGNVRYLVSGQEIAAPFLREVHRGSAFVYENMGALPRAYLVPGVATTNVPGGALQMMSAPNFDPRATAVVNSATLIQLPSTPLHGGATVASYTPDRVAVRTQADRQALLVLADNYYKAWHATVDGRESPILRTDHALRGVIVPAGAHEVVFTFDPPALRTGLILYLLTLGLLAAYGLYLLATHFRPRRPAVRTAEPIPA